MLDPGQSRVFTVGLDYPFDGAILSPGTYEAKIVYYAATRKLIPGAEADIESNCVRFTVAD